MREAVLAGRSDDVRFVLAGDLEDFPYRDPRTGEFRVEARLQDARLAYAPGWPAIERIQGQLRFERAGMDIEVQSGRVWNVALARTHAAIAEFREPLLRVEGSGVGPAQDMVRFVNESPLRTRIDDFARDLAIEGGATLQLALELPIEALDDARVRGSVQLAGNTVRLERTLPPFDAVGGRLEFTEDRLALRSLTATLLGGPVSVEGESGFNLAAGVTTAGRQRAPPRAVRLHRVPGRGRDASARLDADHHLRPRRPGQQPARTLRQGGRREVAAAHRVGAGAAVRCRRTAGKGHAARDVA